jgi:HSP20 family molecular chaperone IbpA
MRCSKCGTNLERGWEFCPHCGEKIRRGLRGFFEAPFPRFRRPFELSFGDIFEEMEREFRDLEKTFFGVRRPFEKFRGGGITIKIVPGQKPVVKTFGDYKDKELEIRKRLGIKKPVTAEEVPKELPKVTEEPETKIEKKPGQITFKVKLPGVKSERDIQIQQLENSIEIRARAANKGYFTILAIPPGAHIIEQKLENEKLILQVGV